MFNPQLHLHTERHVAIDRQTIDVKLTNEIVATVELSQTHGLRAFIYDDLTNNEGEPRIIDLNPYLAARAVESEDEQ